MKRILNLYALSTDCHVSFLQKPIISKDIYHSSTEITFCHRNCSYSMQYARRTGRSGSRYSHRSLRAWFSSSSLGGHASYDASGSHKTSHFTGGQSGNANPRLYVLCHGRTSRSCSSKVAPGTTSATYQRATTNCYQNRTNEYRRWGSGEAAHGNG